MLGNLPTKCFVLSYVCFVSRKITFLNCETQIQQITWSDYLSNLSFDCVINLSNSPTLRHKSQTLSGRHPISNPATRHRYSSRDATKRMQILSFNYQSIKLPEFWMRGTRIASIGDFIQLKLDCRIYIQHL